MTQSFHFFNKEIPLRTKLNKIKLFTDTNITKLEKAINSWFEKNKYIDIVQILQSETLTDLGQTSETNGFSRTITICYREIEQASAKISKPVVPSKKSKKEKISSETTEPVTHNQVTKETDEYKFLKEQLEDVDVSAIQ